MSALCALAFSNTLQNGFHLDDFYRIVDNPGITGIHPWWRHLVDPGTMSPLKSLQQYRPLLPLTLSLNYAVSGLTPASYHLVNIALQTLAAVFCYLLFLTLIRNWDEGFRGKAPPEAIAFLAAAIFALHPVSGFTVNYLSARDLLLMQVFLTASLFSYVRMRLCGETASRWALTLGLFMLSLLSKTNALLAPGLIFLFEFFLAREGLRSRKLWSGVLAFILVGVLFFIWTRFFLNFSDLDNVLDRRAGQLGYLLTQIKLHLFHYLRNFAWPFYIRATPYVRPVDSLLEPRTLIASAVMVASLALAWRLRRRAPLLTFAVFSYFLLMSLESGFLPLYQTAADYRMYPALPYLALALSLVLCKYLSRNVARVAAAVLIFYFGAATFSLNRNFKDEKTFWAHSVRYGSQELGTMNYAMALRGEDDTAARRYLLKSLEINPTYYLAHINLGLLYLDLGETARGLEAVHQGVSLSPPSCLDRSFYWLTIAYKKAGDLHLAYGAISRGLQYNFNNYEHLYEAAYLAQALGKYEEALTYLDRLHLLGPANFKLSRFIAGWCHQALGRPEQAVTEYRLALAHDPRYAQTYANLGYALQSMGRRDEACDFFQKFLNLQPDNAGAKAALAQCLRDGKK